MAKCYAPAGLQREVQLFFSAAQGFHAQRVRRKQAISPRVPVGRESGVLGMVQDGDGYRLRPDASAQRAPAAAGAPSAGASLLEATT